MLVLLIFVIILVVAILYLNNKDVACTALVCTSTNSTFHETDRFTYYTRTAEPIQTAEKISLKKPVKVLAILDESELEYGVQIVDCTVGVVAKGFITLTFWSDTSGTYDKIEIPVTLYNRLLRAWGDPTELSMTWYFEESPRGNIFVTEIVKVDYNSIYED